jgi:hypothetical protein
MRAAGICALENGPVSETALKLAQLHGGFWGEHPRHPVRDWQYEVATNQTRASYWDWVLSQLDLA